MADIRRLLLGVSLILLFIAPHALAENPSPCRQDVAKLSKTEETLHQVLTELANLAAAYHELPETVALSQTVENHLREKLNALAIFLDEAGYSLEAKAAIKNKLNQLVWEFSAREGEKVEENKNGETKARAEEKHLVRGFEESLSESSTNFIEDIGKYVRHLKGWTSLAADNRHFVFFRENGGAIIFDSETGRAVKEIEFKRRVSTDEFSVNTFNLTQDGKSLFFVTRKGEIYSLLIEDILKQLQKTVFMEEEEYKVWDHKKPEDMVPRLLFGKDVLYFPRDGSKKTSTPYQLNVAPGQIYRADFVPPKDSPIFKVGTPIFTDVKISFTENIFALSNDRLENNETHNSFISLFDFKAAEYRGVLGLPDQYLGIAGRLQSFAFVPHSHKIVGLYHSGLATWSWDDLPAGEIKMAEGWTRLRKKTLSLKVPLVMSPDGRFAAMVVQEGTGLTAGNSSIDLYDVSQEGVPLHNQTIKIPNPNGHDEIVTIQFSPDSNKIFVVKRSGDAIVYER